MTKQKKANNENKSILWGRGSILQESNTRNKRKRLERTRKRFAEKKNQCCDEETTERNEVETRKLVAMRYDHSNKLQRRTRSKTQKTTQQDIN